MSSQRPAGEAQILVSYCVGCDKVTFDANPDTDQCECGRELYPVQRFLKKGKAYAIGDIAPGDFWVDAHAHGPTSDLTARLHSVIEQWVAGKPRTGP